MCSSDLPGHRPTEHYVRMLRARLNHDFPSTTLYFLPADIVSQTLNMGLPAPFDVQIYGRDQTTNRAIAARLAEKIRRVKALIGGRPIDLEVDGGVTAENAAEVTAAGANALVAGSAVFKGGPAAYRDNIAAIRHAASLARGEAA